jgi:hypothetical protein
VPQEKKIVMEFTTSDYVCADYCQKDDNAYEWCHYVWYSLFSFLSKVENILKGSLDSIPSPSPSVKIQIMGGKVCLRCKGKTLLGDVNKLLKKVC